jgi:hypothetical protein
MHHARPHAPPEHSTLTAHPFGLLLLLLQFGVTPLHLASHHGRMEVVGQLLAAGAATDAVEHVRSPTEPDVAPLTGCHTI